MLRLRTALYVTAQACDNDGHWCSCLQGVDFFFSNRAHATKFIDFLQAVVPIKFRHDKSLVSHNIHTASYNYKYTFSVEIVPICKVTQKIPFKRSVSGPQRS